MTKYELIEYMDRRFQKAIDFFDELAATDFWTCEYVNILYDILDTADNCNEAMEVLYSI